MFASLELALRQRGFRFRGGVTSRAVRFHVRLRRRIPALAPLARAALALACALARAAAPPCVALHTQHKNAGTTLALTLARYEVAMGRPGAALAMVRARLAAQLPGSKKGEGMHEELRTLCRPTSPLRAQGLLALLLGRLEAPARLRAARRLHLRRVPVQG